MAVKRSLELFDGKIVLQWKIDTDGRAMDMKTVSSTVPSPWLEQCVVRQVGKMSFPKGDAVANVTFPFVFVPR